MVKSIRWRLQLWYAAVLTGVVGGFAVFLRYEANDIMPALATRAGGEVVSLD